ncbi:hypothetical protein GBF38_017243, partial [Nibea albiflora]
MSLSALSAYQCRRGEPAEERRGEEEARYTDQNIETFAHHHACVQLPEDLCHLKTKGEKGLRGIQELSQRIETTVTQCLDMASTQTSLKTPFKDLTSFKGNMKRLYRERLEDAPIKKRVMAEINLKRRSLDSLPKTPKVKREQIEDLCHDSDMDLEGRA